MKGLIRKDLYLILKNFRSFLFITAVFLAFSAFGSSNTFFVIYPMVFAAIIPVSLLSYDENCRWSSYCDALPCTRAQAVSAKYIVSLICQALVFVLSFLVQLLRIKLSGGSMDEFIFLMLSLLFMGFAGPTISLPAIFKLGPEKGRLIYYFVIGITCALSVFLTADAAIQVDLPISALAAGAAVLFVLSWLLSVSFYKKRSL